MSTGIEDKENGKIWWWLPLVYVEDIRSRRGREENIWLNGLLSLGY
jgi:hypothetical protein